MPTTTQLLIRTPDGYRRVKNTNQGSPPPTVGSVVELSHRMYTHWVSARVVSIRPPRHKREDAEYTVRPLLAVGPETSRKLRNHLRRKY